jgi:hypothetical protein
VGPIKLKLMLYGANGKEADEWFFDPAQ